MKRREFLRRVGLSAAAVAFVPSDAFAETPDPLDATLRIGDVLTIEGRYAMNPVTRNPSKHLQQFVVTAITTDGVSLHPTPRPAVKRRERKRAMGTWPPSQAMAARVVG